MTAATLELSSIESIDVSLSIENYSWTVSMKWAACSIHNGSPFPPQDGLSVFRFGPVDNLIELSMKQNVRK